MVDKKQSKSYETYKKVSTLGTGSFGTAYLVECQSNKENAVIKQIDIQGMSEQERKETLAEAKILEVLNHPNIVRFREVYKTKKGKLCIVMDYADGGDLQTLIKDKHKKKQTTGKLEYFNEDQVLNWFTQICLALKHCHDRKILHRDLKSQNIFMTKRGIVKLGDFGIARVLSNTRSKAKTVVGTPYYLSPEIIESQPYSFKSDVWSLGVLLYEMCALQPPFNATSLHQLALRIVNGKFDRIPQTFSNQVNTLISTLLQKNPTARPSINQILKMPMIEKRISTFLEDQDFKDEFSHTLLHNHDVFKAFQRRLEEDKVKKQQEEEQKRKEEERLKQQEIQNQILANIKKQKEEEELKSQMQNLYINKYQPPKEYQNVYQNNEFFNYQYLNYIKNLQEDLSKDSEQELISPKQQHSYGSQHSSHSSEYEDRDDGMQLSQQSSDQSQSSQLQQQQEELNIDIYNDFSSFSKQMGLQYGDQPFKEGFALISKYRDAIYQEDGEEMLANRIKHLFPDIDTTKGFINFCISYLIVQGQQY